MVDYKAHISSVESQKGVIAAQISWLIIKFRSLIAMFGSGIIVVKITS